MRFRTRIALIIAALVFGVTSLTLFSVLQLTERLLRRELGSHLLTLATTAALLIDGDQHATLQSPDQMTGATYRSIKALLIRLRKANAERGVRYLYTMARTERSGIYRFVVDSDEAPDAARIGDEYDARTLPEMQDAFNGPVAEKDFVRDKWGLTLSAYAPIYDSSGLPVAIVGADAELPGLETMRRGIGGRLAISLVLGLLLAFGAGLYSGRVLAEPLDQLIAVTDKVSQGDYEIQVAIKTPPEFSRVSDALNRMLVGLRDRDLMRSTFERYVSRPVAERILQEPGRVILAGERRTVTVLFTDVRGFTPLSERMRPEDVLALLNEYFTQMIDVLFTHEGTLDKFIGDGMMCLFGAPVMHLDDPERAVRTAVAMQQTIARISARRGTTGESELRLGIGIHTGPVVVGNIGSERRLEYSVIGDTVNLASRVQAAAQGGEILVTQAVWELVKDVVECVDVGTRQVKGRDEPVHLHRVLGVRLRSDVRVPEQRPHLRAGPVVQARCLAATTRVEVGRVAEIRLDGAIILSGVNLPEDILRIEVEPSTAGLEPMVIAAERSSTDELDPVEDTCRFVHHVRFKRLSEGERERLAQSLARMIHESA